MINFDFNHEALEIINMNEFTISDVSLFCSPVLKEYNVYNFAFLLNGSDPDTSLTTVLHQINKLCGMYIIQESSDCHSKVTFVTRCLFPYFEKRLNKTVQNVNRMYPNSRICVL